MNINTIITDQIEKSRREEETRKAEEKRQKKAEEQCEAEKVEKERKYLEELKTTFNHHKEIIEGSGVRQILETIVQGLNSSDQDYSPLRDRLVELILFNYRNSIREKSPFHITTPYSSGKSYMIYVSFYREDNTILPFFQVSCRHDNTIFVSMILYQLHKSMDLPINLLNERELLVELVINFLMTD